MKLRRCTFESLGFASGGRSEVAREHRGKPQPPTLGSSSGKSSGWGALPPARSTRGNPQATAPAATALPAVDPAPPTPSSPDSTPHHAHLEPQPRKPNLPAPGS